MFVLLLQYSRVLIQRAFLESLLHAEVYSENFTRNNSFNPHKIPCEVGTIIPSKMRIRGIERSSDLPKVTQEVIKQGSESTVWCQVHALTHYVASP